MEYKYLFVELVSFLIFFCSVSSLQKIEDIKCESSTIYPFVWSQHAPRDNRSAGNYSEVNATSVLDCTENCCKAKSCNVAMYYNKTCFLIECTTSAGCLPVKRNLSSIDLEMVLVRTVESEHLTWEESMTRESEQKEVQEHQTEEDPSQNFRSLFKKIQQFSSRNDDAQNVYGQERYSDAESDLEPVEYEKDKNVRLCGREFGKCDENESCRLIDPRGGICHCKEGYYQRKNKCVKRGVIPVVPASLIENLNFPSQRQLVENSGEELEPEKIRLQVDVASKNIQLPENEASLTASVVPESENEKYSYLWSLVDKPENDKNGTITDQTRKTVKVSHLSEGLYKFKLTVSGQNSYGETFVNLTVLPAKRINIPPFPIITPNYQVIKLPNNKAVLDGSTSTDDDKIESYKWELVQGPINYSPTLQEQPTIELSDLKEPGNYTFKLTVTDSDNAENSTTAIIQVVEEIDYPPQSNAGADVILYLPHNNITLNGTLSTDDHQIISYEWTKDASDESKAVDMQNTHTPYLSLSHLEEGIYTFELKVTDAKGQNSTSKVHVFVKPPTNLPPIARAGNNATISLPLTWVILNANESTDDIKITQYMWKQLSGPSNSLILNANDSIANATSLTLGDYIFEVTVIDENNNNATDRVKITVIQEKNAAPVAKILGGNRNITLPLSVLIINGSTSYDDLAIVNYTWTRESDSLAIGNVIGTSDREPVLQLTNIVAGQYIYKLTVSDEQGLTGSEKVTITVFEDPLLMNLVEVILTAKSTDLKQQELEQLKQKLLLLLGDNVKLNVRHINIDDKTGHVILVFYVSRDTKQGIEVMSALEVQHILKEKFWKDYSILGSSISEIRTAVCQNDCSGHGVCDQDTRNCICDTFWMPDIFFYWHVTEANCDWSILYVFVFIIFLFLLVSGICFAITQACRTRKAPKITKTTSSRPSRLKRPQKYALLHSQDDELPSFNRNTLSDDSDTDSDVLFENSRQKSNGIRNGKSRKMKLGRRIKT